MKGGSLASCLGKINLLLFKFSLSEAMVCIPINNIGASFTISWF